VSVLDGVLDLAPSTLHDFGDVLGRPLDTFFGALKISRSRLLAHV
jgi:hypothetical protein